jgi:hypothetical protein
MREGESRAVGEKSRRGKEICDVSREEDTRFRKGRGGGRGWGCIVAVAGGRGWVVAGPICRAPDDYAQQAGHPLNAEPLDSPVQSAAVDAIAQQQLDRASRAGTEPVRQPARERTVAKLFTNPDSDPGPGTEPFTECEPVRAAVVFSVEIDPVQRGYDPQPHRDREAPIDAQPQVADPAFDDAAVHEPDPDDLLAIHDKDTDTQSHADTQHAVVFGALQ